VRWLQIAEVLQKAGNADRKIEKLKAEILGYRNRLADELHKREALVRQLAEQEEQIPSVYDRMTTSVVSMLTTTGEEIAALFVDGLAAGRNGPEGAAVSAGEDFSRDFKGILYRTMGLFSRLTERKMPMHLSVLVEARGRTRSTGDSKRTSNSSGHAHFRVYSCYSVGNYLGEHFQSTGLVEEGTNEESVTLNDPQCGLDSQGFGMSALEKCMLGSGIIEDIAVSHMISYIGIPKSTLHDVFGGSRFTTSLGSLPAVSGLFIPVGGASPKRIILRLLYVPLLVESRVSTFKTAPVIESKTSESKLSGTNLTSSFPLFVPDSLLRTVMQVVAVVMNLSVCLSKERNEFTELEALSAATSSKNSAENALAKQQLQRMQRLYKVVCREASILLDSPVVNVSSGVSLGTSSVASSMCFPLHPASLPPALASQDIALKILSMIRTLLRSEGQAVLLKDVSTDPPSYQVINSGSALSWPGIESGVFGVVGSPGEHRKEFDGSLVECVMRTHKPLVVDDPSHDSRYVPSLDGNCAAHTPLLLCPLRGRGGGVVGVLLAAKGAESGPFVAEDVSALEMTAAFGSLSLYWCQGLGALHNKLVRSANKMSQIESAVDSLRRGSK
jgi:hypothetical protein